jgi:hypothetical protein
VLSLLCLSKDHAQGPFHPACPLSTPGGWVLSTHPPGAYGGESR